MDNPGFPRAAAIAALMFGATILIGIAISIIESMRRMRRARRAAREAEIGQRNFYLDIRKKLSRRFAKGESVGSGARRAPMRNLSAIAIVIPSSAISPAAAAKPPPSQHALRSRRKA